MRLRVALAPIIAIVVLVTIVVAAAPGVLAAGGGGGAGNGNPAPWGPPPTVQTPGGGDVDTGHGGGGGGSEGGDNDSADIDGCSGWYRVDASEVTEAYPRRSARRDGETSDPYIQDDDYADWEGNPSGQWMRCDTGPPTYSVARAWYDYPDLNSLPALNYRDRLPAPTVRFSPPTGAMVVDVETWPTLADYGDVDIREGFEFYNFQARPQTLVWDPGDGSGVLRCPIPEPRPRPGAHLGDRCRHIYERPSIAEDDDAPDSFRSTVTVEYDIYTQVNGGAWQLVVEDYAGQTAVQLVPVREIQAVAD